MQAHAKSPASRTHAHALVDVTLVPNEDLIDMLVCVSVDLVNPRFDALPRRLRGKGP